MLGKYTFNITLSIILLYTNEYINRFEILILFTYVQLLLMLLVCEDTFNIKNLAFVKR